MRPWLNGAIFAKVAHAFRTVDDGAAGSRGLFYSLSPRR